MPVESRKGAVPSSHTAGRPVSLPRSSNRTCPFRASGFPTDFTNGSRTTPQVDVAQSQHAQSPEHNRIRESGRAARSPLVAAAHENPHTPPYRVARRPQHCRTPATENHEIIGVVDHLGVENLTPSGDPPVLQKTVHIQVGE